MNDRDILELVLNIGILMNSEHDYNKLLEIILEESMKVTNADAGTLYLKEDNKLQFMIMKNNTFSKNPDTSVSMPPVEMSLKNVCSYSAIKRKVINIPDVYTTSLFSFDGPKKYDAISGYLTKSMLVIPLIDNVNEVIGVIQLINALDERKKVRSFTKEEEKILFAIASQSAVVLSNMLMSHQIESMMQSMADALTCAIDARTSYTANHSRNVSRIIREFLTYAKDNGLLFITEKDIEEVSLAALLHDVGKIGISKDVMDKPTRLGKALESIQLRAQNIRSLFRISLLQGEMTEEVYEQKTYELDRIMEAVTLLNHVEVLPQELMEQIQGMKDYSYGGMELFTEEDKKNLLIEQGTLNSEERALIERHAEYSNAILSKICFSANYSHVVEYVSKHHEFLDGSGYPNHLTEESIPMMARVLTIVDIYESLIAKDRPYKAEVPVREAMKVLWKKGKEGKLDIELLDVFEQYIDQLN